MCSFVQDTILLGFPNVNLHYLFDLYAQGREGINNDISITVTFMSKEKSKRSVKIWYYPDPVFSGRSDPSNTHPDPKHCTGGNSSFLNTKVTPSDENHLLSFRLTINRILFPSR